MQSRPWSDAVFCMSDLGLHSLPITLLKWVKVFAGDKILTEKGFTPRKQFFFCLSPFEMEGKNFQLSSAIVEMYYSGLPLSQPRLSRITIISK